mmetsp:Transcript_15725/g.37201  ORF Transcript_15725/g.37201 Transcript_15725/m.37201 type:complete len:830 (-) Transcript_15725:1712-4201(-)
MREDGAGRSLDVDDLRVDHHRLFVVEGRLRSLEDESAVDVLLQLVVLLLGVVGVRVRVDEPRQLERRRQDRGKIEVLRLGVPQALVVHQQVRAAHQLVHRLDAEGRHGLPDLLGHHPQEVDHVLGHTLELLAQLRVLGGDADRAHVEVALAHHDAAERDEGGGREACLLGAQQEGHHDVTPRLDLPVCLDHHARAQVVHHERLVRLGQTQLPGQAGTLDAAPLSGARATIMSGDQDVIRLGLGHAGRNHPDTDFGDKLDADPRLGVRALEVVDELREVLDGVDVVVGRRRDERHAWLGQAEGSNVLVDLLAGELASLSGLRALSKLDLDLLGGHEILRGHAETARGNLLDLGGGDVAVLEVAEVWKGRGHALAVDVGDGYEALLVLAALARVRLAAEAVHGDGERLVRLARQRAERHAARAELAHHLLHRLDLVEGDGLAVRLDVDEVTEDGEGSSLERLLEELVLVDVLLPQRLVKDLGERRGVVVVLLSGVVLDEPVVVERLERGLGEASGLERGNLVGDVGHGHASDAGDGALERQVHHVGTEADGLEDLGSVVRGEQRDADLGHDLVQSSIDGFTEVGERSLDADLRELAVLHHGLGLGGSVPGTHTLHGRVRVHGRGSEADQRGDVVRAPCLGGLGHERRLQTELLGEEVVMHGSDGHQRRDVGLVSSDAALGEVREHQDLGTIAHSLLSLLLERLDLLLEPAGPLGDIVQGRELDNLAAALLDHLHLVLVDDRGLDLDLGRVGLRRRLDGIALLAEVHVERHHQVLAQRVDGRVGYLGEALLEVVVEDVGLLGEDGQRRVVTHAEGGLLAGRRHVRDLHLHVL